MLCLFFKLIKFKSKCYQVNPVEDFNLLVMIMEKFLEDKENFTSIKHLYNFYTWSFYPHYNLDFMILLKLLFYYLIKASKLILLNILLNQKLKFLGGKFFNKLKLFTFLSS